MLSTWAVRLTSVGVPPNSLLAPDRSCILHRAVAASWHGGGESGQVLHASMALKSALAAVQGQLGAAQNNRQALGSPEDTGCCGSTDQNRGQRLSREMTSGNCCMASTALRML